MFFKMSALAQNEYLARLQIFGRTNEFGVSPDEEIWVTNRAGNLFYTSQIGRPWELGSFGNLDRYSPIIGGIFERISVISRDTLIISGYIDDDRKQNFVYWSGDHGNTWKKVIFGESSWLDAFFVDDKGRCWASGSSQLIYYSEDKGQTWKTFDKVEKKGDFRVNAIHFADDGRIGLFGSFSNLIYRTSDNCITWEKLPTPLSQKKYQWLSKAEPPEIVKIRMFGDYYIVNQQGRVFISKSNHIDWKYLPEAANFEINDQGGIYTVNQDLTAQLFDKDFNCVWKSKDKFDNPPSAISVKNGKLFALTHEYVYKVSPNGFIASELLTNQTDIPEPYLKVTYKDTTYGFAGRDILKMDKAKGQWFRFLTVDFPIENATLFKDDLIIAGANFTKHYRVETDYKTVSAFDLPATLFGNKKVVEWYLESGSRGCFHYYNNTRRYLRKGPVFVAGKTPDKKTFLNAMSKKLAGASIDRLVKIIDTARFRKVRLSDLNITTADADRFKLYVDSERKNVKQAEQDDGEYEFDDFYNFPGENIDFGFYKRLADALPHLPAEDINNAFWKSYGNWSTTTNWRRITFVFADGTKAIVENTDDKPNYLCTPWLVNYEGLQFSVNSIKFGREIEKLTKGQFFDKPFRDKKYALFNITDYLYRKKLSVR